MRLSFVESKAQTSNFSSHVEARTRSTEDAKVTPHRTH